MRSCSFSFEVHGKRFVTVLCEIGESSRNPDDYCSNILNVLNDYHNIVPYALGLLTTNTLPRSVKNGRKVLNVEQCKKAFSSGDLPLIRLVFPNASSKLFEHSQASIIFSDHGLINFRVE